MNYQVVSADSADLDAVLDSWVDLVDGQRRYGSHLEAEANRSTARDLLGQYIVGEMLSVARPAGVGPGGTILGFVMFYLEQGVFEQDRMRGVIENVYVCPEARGEGTGSALLDHAEMALAERGAEVITLSAMADNETAIEWYEERGYEPHRIDFERSLEESGEGKL